MLQKLLFILLMVTTLTIAGTTTSVASPGNGNGNGGGSGNGAGNCIVDEVDSGSMVAGLTKDEYDWKDWLLHMREEEKLARDSYLVLGTNEWGLVIFENIADSEQKHMDAMKNLLDCYKLPDPVIDEIGVFSDPELQALFDFLMEGGSGSMMDGLKVGALIEETDINDIRNAIEVTDYMHIVGTYENLVCGSRNHLRAFIRQIEINGGSYTPIVLDPDEFWAIAHSDMEQDCGNSKRKGKFK